VPNAVCDATNDYRHGEDEIAQFLEECTVSSPSATTKASDLYDSYRTWSLANGLSPMSGTAFGKRIVARGFGKERQNQGVVYRGVGLVM